jgi:hypothetical protein
MEPYPRFDLKQVNVLPLRKRRSMATLEETVVEVTTPPPTCDAFLSNQIDRCTADIESAIARKASVVLIYGAHLIKNGGQALLNQMMDRGWISHLATNGAGIIHDWEFAFHGKSTECVRSNVASGTFGTWDETGRHIQQALLLGGIRGLGFGQSLGKFAYEDGGQIPDPDQLEQQIRDEPGHPLTSARVDLLQAIRENGWPAGPLMVLHRYRNCSPLAQAIRHQVPFTVHPGIGYDIYTNHPLFNGGVVGRAAGIDFQVFSESLTHLEGGVVLNIGTAIMGPQVFEKSLSCVNNVRRQKGLGPISGHAIHVVDLQDGGHWDWTQGEPPKDSPAYYLRFCKTYARMGGAMHYVQSDNITFLHNLFHRLEARQGRTAAKKDIPNIGNPDPAPRWA